MMTEAQGCAILQRAFQERGYRVECNVNFVEGGVHCELDGWDAAERVGFEYLVRTDGDHDDLTGAEQTELAHRMERGDLYVLIVDETPDAKLLRFAAERFLDEVERRRGVAPKRPAPKRTSAPRKKGAPAKEGVPAKPNRKHAPAKKRVPAKQSAPVKKKQSAPGKKKKKKKRAPAKKKRAPAKTAKKQRVTAKTKSARKTSKPRARR